MTRAIVNRVEADRIDDETPPSGTAIVRPLRHVRAVRERYLRRFVDPSEAATLRSVRAWAWALGESAVAPVTDRLTTAPPSRSDVEAEITIADERRLRGDRKDRADAAATILRWLIGGDDRVPVRGEDRGVLVGGFGHVVRSLAQIADILAVAVEGQRRAVALGWDVEADLDERRFARQDAGYLDGVVATLAWVLGERTAGPVTSAHPGELTTRDLKAERVHAEDVIKLARQPWIADGLPTPSYGEGVKFSINWLLGDSTVPPVDPAGHRLSGSDSRLSAMPRNT